MKLAVLTTSLFGTPMAGGEVCTARLLAALREAGHAVTLFGHGDAAAAAAWCDRAHSLGPAQRPFAEQPGAQRVRSIVGAWWCREAITVHRQGGRRVARELAARLRSGFDGCIVDHLQAWPWLGGVPPLPAMLVHHNVESDNYLRLARAANRGCQGNRDTRHLERLVMRREAHALRRLELHALQRARAVACLSEADAARMAELGALAGERPRARLHVLPGHAAAHAAGVAQAARTAAATPRRVGLLGSWTWAPNRAALSWMLREVWPHLQGRCQLVLAGSGLEGLALPPGTQVLGRVAEPADFYAAVDVVAIPSLQGSGVQEKAIEAIGRGATVVATAHALRGLGPGLPPGVHCADEPERFASLCEQAPLDAASTAAARAWSARRAATYRQALSQCLQALAAPAASVPQPVHWADVTA
jgi:Glycosyl transferases group 1/Glycosyltransferase Family 4